MIIGKFNYHEMPFVSFGVYVSLKCYYNSFVMEIFIKVMP